MSSLKEKLPDLAALERGFNAVLEAGLDDFIASTHVRREAVLSYRRYLAVSFAFSITTFIAIFFVYNKYQGWLDNLLLGFAMLWLTVVLLSARRWLTNEKLLTKEINMALAPIIMNTIGKLVVFSSHTDNQKQIKELLADSELITIPNIDVATDDEYVVHDDSKTAFREMVVTQKHKDKLGRDEHVVIFKGVFVVAELSRVHSAKTFISTEGDRVGFAHRNFWADMLEHTEVKETELEWNDFEDLLHVASSDGSAAREILTANFMQDLYEWWLEHRLNIRISFKGNRFYMLLPEESIKINTSTTSTKPAAIRRYAFSLVRPIWRTMVLLEDVS